MWKSLPYSINIFFEYLLAWMMLWRDVKCKYISSLKWLHLVAEGPTSWGHIRSSFFRSVSSIFFFIQVVSQICLRCIGYFLIKIYSNKSGGFGWPWFKNWLGGDLTRSDSPQACLIARSIPFDGLKWNHFKYYVKITRVWVLGWTK